MIEFLQAVLHNFFMLIATIILVAGFGFAPTYACLQYLYHKHEVYRKVLSLITLLVYYSVMFELMDRV